MNRYKVTIKPVGSASAVSYLVGGFDSKDALQQGKYRWLKESDDHFEEDIESAFAGPYQPEGAAQ